MHITHQKIIYFFKHLLFLLLFFVCSTGNAQEVVVEKIVIIGNKVTKNSIISRELVFDEGDTVPSAILKDAVQRSKENLLNTSLFNFVEITTQAIDIGKVYVIIELSERWYIFPVPIFEVVDRNFNEWWLRKDFSRTNYGVFLNWDNFRGRKENVRLLVRFGYSQRLSLNYAIPYIDKKQKRRNEQARNCRIAINTCPHSR